jgi:O-antigen biosynthesis protein
MIDFRLRWNQYRALRRRIGGKGTTVFVVKKLLGIPIKQNDWVEDSRGGSPSGVDRAVGYLYQKRPIDTRVSEERSINWYIPDFGPSSGGHLNIVRFAALLRDRGFESRFVLVGPTQLANAQQVSRALSGFGFGTFTCFVGAKTAIPARIHLATGWQTVSALPAPSELYGCGYFVQDFEPDFYPAGNNRSMASNTYRSDLPAFTAGSWVADRLAEFGVPCEFFGFSADTDLYFPRKRKNDGIVRILFYARPPTERRCFEVGILALQELHRRHPEYDFILVGWDVPSSHTSFPFLNAGMLAIPELPELYSSVDVALVLSATNASLLPLEIMACGTTVVSNSGPNVEWLLDESVAFLAPLDPESLADEIERAVRNEAERRRRSEEGLKRIREFSWETQADKFAEWLRKLEVTGP